MCQYSGARLRRADTLTAAKRHLQVYCPSFVLVDLGLPDGSGLDLIRGLAQVRHGVAAVLAISGDDGQDQAAAKAGADGFIAKPFRSLAAFQEVLLQFMPQERRPLAPRIVNDVAVTPDRLSYVDDLRHAAGLLQAGRGEGRLDYTAQFLLGVSRSAGDEAVQDASMTLAVAHMRDASPDAALKKLRDLLDRRIAAAPAV
jgi:CheY-like chemotaxis protein